MAGPGEVVDFKLLDKHSLKIDLTYQREVYSRLKVISIASHFRWSLFGALTIVANERGEYFVADGGHRLRATMLRSDIHKVPCLIFSAASIKEEAELFVKLNTEPRGVRPFDRHKAQLVAGYEVAVKAEQIIRKHGYRFVRSAPKEFEIESIHSIHRIVARNAEIADLTVEILCEVAAGMPFHLNVIGGLFYLISCNQSIDFRTWPLQNMKMAGDRADGGGDQTDADVSQ